ncbi:MAG: glycosyltransferase family 4 protein [Candidatus Omnitrophica bacterium]|nr:glycosyltransferase family 4 protein [Candidatus Omnitrophota bacterium]
MYSKLRIGHVVLNRPLKDVFISFKLNTENFLRQLSAYATVEVLSANSVTESLPFSLAALKLDYLLLNLRDFKMRQLLLREERGLAINFIVVLDTVYPWIEELSTMVVLLREGDVIISPSEYGREQFFRISRRKEMYVIPNCIDLRFIRECVNPKPVIKRRSIGFMGRLIPPKGVEAIIESLPHIRKELREDLSLRVIGPLSGEGLSDDYQSPYVRHLKRKVLKLGLRGKVEFSGMKTGAEKYRLLAECELFVFPTFAKEENFSVALLEALGCGLPVIATDWAGNREIVRDASNGYLLPIESDPIGRQSIDKNKLIATAVGMLSDRENLLLMRKRALESAKKYDFRVVMPRLIRLLTDKRLRSKIIYKSRWGYIRNKRLIDFGKCFRKEILFFLRLDPAAYITFAHLYTGIRFSRKCPGRYAGRSRLSTIKASRSLYARVKDDLFQYISGYGGV